MSTNTNWTQTSKPPIGTKVVWMDHVTGYCQDHFGIVSRHTKAQICIQEVPTQKSNVFIDGANDIATLTPIWDHPKSYYTTVRAKYNAKEECWLTGSGSMWQKGVLKPYKEGQTGRKEKYL